MNGLPDFLKIQQPAAQRYPHGGRSVLTDYQPLLGLWIIDLALTQGWARQSGSRYTPSLFATSEFAVATGLHGLTDVLCEAALVTYRLSDRNDSSSDDDTDLDEVDSVEQLAERTERAEARRARRLRGPHRNKELETRMLEESLRNHRQALLDQGLRRDLPLIVNVERLARMILLSDVEKAILVFAAALGCFTFFSEVVSSRRYPVSDDELRNMLAVVTGHSLEDVHQALRPDSVLLSSGLLVLDHDDNALADKLKLLAALRPVMLDNLSSEQELSNRILKPASAGNLGLDDYPHLQRDTALLQSYLRGSAKARTPGVNILLYGPAGTGKTEYAKALVASLGWRLFEIDYADPVGDPLSPNARLQSVAFNQRALKDRDSVALIFDEVEDVLPGEGGQASFMSMLQSRPNAKVQAKAWVNRVLEDNPVPTIWITNDADIDKAYLRRFDYTLQLAIPPRPVRQRILQRILGEHCSDTTALDSLAALEDLLPAQVERASRVARLAGLGDPKYRWQGITQVLERSREVLGQSKAHLGGMERFPYSLDYLNADVDLQKVAAGLQQQGRASVCLYGPPGTGKTAYCRYLADQLGAGLMVRRASDLISKWIGESERNIAQAFADAEREGAVLLIDEVDGFLRDRGRARASWEVTLVNEMLTQMESFKGVFLASTNLIDDLDEASLRRFDLKVRFGYLSPSAARGLLQSYCLALKLDEPPESVMHDVGRLTNLTPGDFAAVARRHRFYGVQSPAQFLLALQAETALKKSGQSRPVGFL